MSKLLYPFDWYLVAYNQCRIAFDGDHQYKMVDALLWLISSFVASKPDLKFNNAHYLIHISSDGSYVAMKYRLPRWSNESSTPSVKFGVILNKDKMIKSKAKYCCRMKFTHFNDQNSYDHHGYIDCSEIDGIQMVLRCVRNCVIKSIDIVKNEYADNHIKIAIPQPHLVKDMELKIGQRVRIQSGESGVIKFIGPVLFKGERVGLEMDVPFKGGHNGRVKRKRYFKAADFRGCFVEKQCIRHIILNKGYDPFLNNDEFILEIDVIKMIMEVKNPNEDEKVDREWRIKLDGSDIAKALEIRMDVKSLQCVDQYWVSQYWQRM